MLPGCIEGCIGRYRLGDHHPGGWRKSLVSILERVLYSLPCLDGSREDGLDGNVWREIEGGRGRSCVVGQVGIWSVGLVIRDRRRIVDRRDHRWVGIIHDHREIDALRAAHAKIANTIVILVTCPDLLPSGGTVSRIVGGSFRRGFDQVDAAGVLVAHIGGGERIEDSPAWLGARNPAHRSC